MGKKLEHLINRIKSSVQHRYIYHFTDKENLDCIARHGLLSKNRMRQMGFWPKFTGGNQLSHELDDHRGISDYVSLCLTRNHPMAYRANSEGRLPNPVYLGVSPDVLRLDGVQIALGVANANDVEILPIAGGIDRIDQEVVYTRTDWRDPAINARLSAAEKWKFLCLIPCR